MKKILAIPLLLLSTLFALSGIPGVHALTGTVCPAPTTATGCPTPPVSFSTTGTTLTLNVNIAGSDATNGFDVAVQANPTILSGASVSLAGNILSAGTPFIQNICINNSPVKGACSPGVDGPGVVHVTDIVFGFVTTSPTTGLLFGVTYNVVGTGTTSIGYVSSTASCPTSSSPPLCVTIASPGGAADTEVLQTATFSNIVAPTLVLHWEHHLSIAEDAATQSFSATIANLGSATLYAQVRMTGTSAIGGTFTCPFSGPPTLNEVSCASGVVTLAPLAVVSETVPLVFTATAAGQKFHFTATLVFGTAIDASGNIINPVTSPSAKSGAFAVVP